MKRLHHLVGSLFLGQYPSLLRHPLSTRSEFLEKRIEQSLSTRSERLEEKNYFRSFS